MIADCHNHTCFSGDSENPVRSQIERAIELGMEELCITDHHDYDAKCGDIDFTLDIPKYLSYMQQMKEEYKDKIQLRIGIELGLQPHLKTYFREFLNQYSFDFVIGSTHVVDGIDPYFPEYFQTRGEEEGHRRYFETVLENCIKLDDYDAAAHLDYVVRYGPTKNCLYSYKKYQDIIDEILRILLEKGKALECNTAGLAKGMGQPHPHPDILRRYHEMGGELLTVGSDAHEAKYLGYAFEQTRELLLSCGFRYYTVYVDRKPIFHKL